MKFNVTDVEFDFTDDEPISDTDAKGYVVASLGVWDADDEDDLIDEITDASGWCVKSVDYEIQLK